MYHHYSLTVFCICLYVSLHQQAFILSYALLLLSSILSFPLEGLPFSISCWVRSTADELPQLFTWGSIYFSFIFEGQLCQIQYFFFFQNFAYIISLPLAFKVSAEKSAEKLMRSLLCGRSLFSCCFQSSFFVLDFQQFNFNVLVWSSLGLS